MTNILNNYKPNINKHVISQDIYIMQETLEPYRFKVGIAYDVVKRHKEIQVGHSSPIEVIHFSRADENGCINNQNTREIEQKIHKELKTDGYHTYGEWFCCYGPIDELFVIAILKTYLPDLDINFSLSKFKEAKFKQIKMKKLHEIIFSKYGKHFQENLFHIILSDKIFAKNIISYIKAYYFDIPYISYLMNHYLEYYEKNHEIITLLQLITLCKEDLTKNPNNILRDQIVEYLTRIKIKPNLDNNIDYIKEKSFKEIKLHYIGNALDKLRNNIFSISDERIDLLFEKLKFEMI